jgi:predicted 3-demethylubiquinone-9 3-methyltransferase (glyoxalase superfamily)
MFQGGVAQAALDLYFATFPEFRMNNYGFSQRFGWLADRFGVSWQLNLA